MNKQFIIHLKIKILKIKDFLLSLLLVFKRAFAQTMPLLFGKTTIHFTPPPWWGRVLPKVKLLYEKIKLRLKSCRRRSLALGFLILVGLSSLVVYLKTRPKPDYVAVSVINPQSPNYYEKITSPVVFKFSKSAAPATQVGKFVTSGVELKPSIKGKWFWKSDTELSFTPDAFGVEGSDWMAGENYIASFEKAFFPSHLVFESRKFEFKTNEMAAIVSQKSFYQDPKDPKNKRATFQILFNYAPDMEDLKKRLSMDLQEKEGLLGIPSKRSFLYTIGIGDYPNQIEVVSDLLPIPEQDSEMQLNLAKGYRPTKGQASEKEVSAKVDVPGMYSYFRIEKEEVTFARNLQYEPEQVLIIETRAELLSESLAKGLRVSLLPLKNPDVKEPKKKRHNWTSASEITPRVRSLLTPVKFEVIHSEVDLTKLHSFKVNLPAGRSLLVEISKGLESFGGYRLANDYSSVTTVPEYPKELMIMSEGSLLSYSGEKKIPLLARNVSKVEFELLRILPEQINQLIVNSFRYVNDFRHPDFSSFSEDSMAERFVEKRELSVIDPRETQYFSFDLKPYVEKNPGNKGVFFLTVRQVGGGQQDQRLVLLSDLGIIHKKNADKTSDVFLQDVHSGGGIGGGQVDVLGTNGIVIFSTTSDVSGRARIPDLSDFKREKYPVAIVARRGQDFAFLPMGMESRVLDYSRFDVGGLYENFESERLYAYLFSNRGLYRPGEDVNLGLLVRSRNWAASFDKVPVTWSVVDPRGVEIKKDIVRASNKDFLDLRFSTSETAPTGTYTVNVFIEGKNKNLQMIGSENLRIEEFVPDSLRISTSLVGQKTNGWIGLDSEKAVVKSTVSLQNLFGTAAENRLIRAQMTLVPAQPYFDEYKDYVFVAFDNKEKTLSEPLSEAHTNQKGEADFDLDLSRFRAPLFWLRFEAEGFESAGGRSVMSVSQTLVSPLKYLIGFKKDADLAYLKRKSVHPLELIAIDADLRKSAANNLKLSLIEKKFVSVLMKQPNGLYKYQSVLKEVEKSTQNFSISQSGHKLDLPTKESGDFAFVIKDAEGLALNRIDFSVVGEANLNRSLDRNAELQLVLNGQDFEAGQEIEMQIKAPYVGSGLITIEREKTYASKWFQTTTNSSVEKIMIPQGLEGNAFVTVTFLRSSTSKEVFMSPLSYAVKPFSLALDKKRIELTVDTPKRSKPGETMLIRYSATKPTKAIVYGVDEGILQVAKYKTPNPLAFFFQRRALQVRTYQLLDLLLPEFSILQSLSAPGGDEGAAALGKNLNPFKRKNQQPVLFWSGVVDAGPTPKTYSYNVPDSFNGNLKVMMVAATSDSFGSASRDALVRGDLILNPSVPAFVAGGDEFDVSMGVFNQSEGSGSEAKVNVKVEPDSSLEVISKSQQDVGVAEGRESSLVFKFKAKSSFGSKKIKFVANLTGLPKATQHTTEVSVRPAGPYQVEFVGGLASQKSFEIPVQSSFIPEYRKLETGLSPSPLILVRGIKSNFENYPYLCTEQLLSRGMGALFYKTLGDIGYTLEESKSSFESTLQLIRSRQKSSGAFSLYPGGAADKEATLHTALYLTFAKENQFAVPQDILQKTIENLSSQEWQRYSTLEEQRQYSMTLYLLARNGVVKGKELTGFVKLLKKTNPQFWTDNIGALYLAATMKLYQQESEALSRLKEIQLNKIEASGDSYYYSALTLDGIFFWLLSQHFPNQIEKYWTDDVQRRVLTPLQTGHISTFAGAYILAAFESMKRVGGEAFIAGRGIQEISAQGEKKNLNLPPKAMAFASFSDSAKKLAYTVPQLPAFYYQIQSGFESTAPQSEIKKGLEVSREYMDSTGKALSTLKIGQEIQVRLRVRSTGESHSHVALVDLFPGGFEPVLEAIAASSGNEESGEMPYVPEGDETYQGDSEEGAFLNPLRRQIESPLMKTLFQTLYPVAYAQEKSYQLSSMATDFVDRREDRVVLYTSVGSDLSEFIYKLKATNKGVFVVPAPFAQGMYDKNLLYRGMQSKITIE